MAVKAGMMFALSLIAAGTVAAGPVKVVHNSKELHFSYSSPADAGAIPSLDKKFRADLEKSYGEALANARDEKEAARKERRSFNKHIFSAEWSIAGKTKRFLSLQSKLITFGGGAHPNTTYDALLWDRHRGKDIDVRAVLPVVGSVSVAIRKAYCEALDKERLKRRGGEKIGGEFDRCPKFADLAIAPADKNNNGRFEVIEFVASPYVAGPYAEGEYEVSLPVTAALIRALRPEYRASFEVQRQ